MSIHYSSTTKSEHRQFIASLKTYINNHSADSLDANNISSMGIGLKITDGTRTDELCLQFTVDQKLSIDMIENTDTRLIPKTIQINGKDLPTDVIERTYELSYQVIESIDIDTRKSRIDPIHPGVSISHKQGTAGTAGCIVYDRTDNTPYILSNWHVLHGAHGQIGDDIVQPGALDDPATDHNRSGRLVRSFLGEAGDCAICTIDNRGFIPSIFKLNTVINKLSEPELLDHVVKSGRTTDVTYGIVERIHVITQINYPLPTGLKNIGCFEIGVDPDRLPSDGEISSPGDSGSAWLIADQDQSTSILAGLHFAGEGLQNQHEHALACYPKAVFDQLSIKVTDQPIIDQSISSGYNANFLSHVINPPELNDESVAYDLDGSTKIDYAHFSLSLHKERKFAIWTAWNIDGGQIKKLSRRAINFKLDPRIPRKYQIGNRLYKSNNIDRGHIAKRADLIWGSLDEATQANKDSFYYTNIVPQLDTFNQSGQDGIWGQLENAVFDAVIIDNLKVSVIGGPVFSNKDILYRNVQIPKEYFKVIIYEEDGLLKSRSFLLTQHIDQVEAIDFSAFKVYEVTLLELEDRCSFTFDPRLIEATSIVELEAVQTRHPLSDIREISW